MEQVDVSPVSRDEGHRAYQRDIEKAVADFIHADGYARYRPELGRCETMEETIARTEEMHLARFEGHLGAAAAELRWAFELVRSQRVLPAMRSMRYGGAAVAQHHARLYNTWAAHCDYPRVFAEAFYLLMCGSGIGFSVQRQHVGRLPPVAPTAGARVEVVVADSIEGWAHALHLLVRSYFEGFAVAFDTSLIRPRGAPLHTSGGVAPGPEPFIELEDRVRRLFEGARGRRLRPIECYDALCHVAQAATAGGSGRSAMLCVFSHDDTEMMLAKTGRWYETAPWRRMSNNSSALLRGRSDRAVFATICQYAKEWGDPGVFWVDDLDVCSNSCVEVGFYPKLTVRSENIDRLQRQGLRAAPGQALSGFQGATLSEINGARVRSTADLIEAARAAAIINTFQAAYTTFPFLGPVAELLCERDAMLGVGITGMMACEDICLDPAAQRLAAAEVVRTNRRWAALLGIRPATRTTLIKPAGKTSLVFGCVSNGIHPYHADRYILRVRARPGSTAFERFRAINPHQCAETREGAPVALFPLSAPTGARTRDNLDALRHLEWIRSTNLHWVRAGATGGDPARHNVSNTVTVREDEWHDVQQYLWDHQDVLAGVALMGQQGERDHSDAPLQSIRDSADRSKFEALLCHHRPVDYTAL